MQCGLLGEKLSHSYSPQIHAQLADYHYDLFEKSPDQVEDFVRYGEWHGLNVTIPYKKTVIPFCDDLSETAESIGSVNTLLRRGDGSIYGDNTDAFGFEMLLDSVLPDTDLVGKKVLVLGTGGASATVCTVLRNRNATVVPVSRTGENNYQNISRHSDAALIVNTTPLGMYPHNGEKAVDLTVFPFLNAVLDVIYNPARTALLLQAEEQGIPHANGLLMLVAQAKRSAEIFLGRPLLNSEIARITSLLSFQMQNLILVGMPGSGKTTIASILADRLGRQLSEADIEISRQADMSIPEIFEKEGEAGFRRRETAVLSCLGRQSGLVISTGGGCVTKSENYPLLHQNGIIIRIMRDTDRLAREGRPLSQQADLAQMAQVRNPFYEQFADLSIDNNNTPEETVNAILEALR